MKLSEFAQHKFDVLVMVFLIVLFTAIIIIFGHNSDYAGIVDWTEKGALGPLLGAMVYSLQNRGVARFSDPGSSEGGKVSSVHSETTRTEVLKETPAPTEKPKEPHNG